MTRASPYGLPALLLTLLVAAVPVQAQQQPQPPAVPASAKAAAVRHTPDTATQQTMLRLSEILGRQRSAVDQQQLTSADYRVLADQMDGLLNELAKSAGHSPSAARKAFGSIVERDLRWASDTMRRSPKAEAQRTGALAAAQALRNYGSFFDHPGWTRH